jgi:hypothetical protein
MDFIFTEYVRERIQLVAQTRTATIRFECLSKRKQSAIRDCCDNSIVLQHFLYCTTSTVNTQ